MQRLSTNYPSLPKGFHKQLLYNAKPTNIRRGNTRRQAGNMFVPSRLALSATCNQSSDDSYTVTPQPLAEFSGQSTCCADCRTPAMTSPPGIPKQRKVRSLLMPPHIIFKLSRREQAQNTSNTNTNVCSGWECESPTTRGRRWVYPNSVCLLFLCTELAHYFTVIKVNAQVVS